MLDLEKTIVDLVRGKAGRGPSPNRPPESPFGAFLSDGTPYLSPSQVVLLLQCPKKWDFSYLQMLPRKPGLASMMGTTAHAFLEVLHAPISKGTLRDRGEVFEAVLPEALTIWSRPELRPFLTADELTPEGAGNGIARAVATASDELRRMKGPLRLEANNVVKTSVADHAVALRYIPDVYQDGAGRVTDYKFPGKKPYLVNGKPEPKYDHVVSTMLYAWGHIQQGLQVRDVEILYTPIGSDQSYSAIIPVTPARLAQARLLFERAARIVLSRNLPGTPMAAGFLCAPKWCDFYSRCSDAPANFGAVEA